MGALQDAERRAADRESICCRVRELIVTELALDLLPEWIDNDQPLFGRGLELDSLDAIDVLIAIEDAFGVELAEDDPATFGSVNALVDQVLARTVPVDLHDAQH
jgi:acyl carrier protein